MLPVFFSLLALSLLFCCFDVVSPAAAAAPYCDESLAPVWCNMLRTAPANQRTSNFPGSPGFDANRHWVVNSGDEFVVYPGTDYVPGGFVPLGGQKATFVVGTGAVRTADNSTLPGPEASLAGHLFLCDDASVVVQNATLRLAQDYEYQYYVWAADRAHVQLRDVRLTTLARATIARNPNEHGNSWWSFRSRSSLDSNAVSSLRPGKDVMQLAAMDDARVEVGLHDIFMETYVAGRANFSLSHSQWFDTFLTVCSGDFIDLTTGFPELCDLLTECMTPQHAPVNFAIGPPRTPFTYTVLDSKVYSWAVECNTHGSAIVGNTPARSNFAIVVGLDGNPQPPTQHAYKGRVAGNRGNAAVPATLGPFTATHNVTLLPGTAVVAIHLWFNGPDFSVDLAPGSVVGDVLGTNTNLSFTATKSTLELGQTIIASSNAYAVKRTAVGIRVRLDQPSWLVAAGGSTITGDTTLNGGTLVLYDSALPSGAVSWTVAAGVSYLCSVSLNVSSSGLISQGAQETITPSFQCFDQSVSTPAGAGAPSAQLKIDGVVVQAFTSNTTQKTVPFNSTEYSPGVHEILLEVVEPRLAALHASGFVSMKRISFAPAATTGVASTTGSVSTTAVAPTTTGSTTGSTTAVVDPSSSSATGTTGTTGSTTGTTGTTTGAATTGTATTAGAGAATSSGASDSSPLGIIIGVVFAVGVLCLVGAVVFWQWRKQQPLRSHSDNSTELDAYHQGEDSPTGPLDAPRSSHASVPLPDIDWRDVEVSKRIGEGQFGEVFLARYDRDKVAIKTVKGGDLAEFKTELKMVKEMNHPNVVRFFGVVEMDAGDAAFGLVFEYCNAGSLDELLRKQDFDAMQLRGFCADIAAGVVAVHRRRMLHRDIAARNCLVVRHHRRYQVKLADLGLSRQLEDGQDVYCNTSAFPARWAAPEVVGEGKCTQAADVYSLGITFWEVHSGGRSPYSNVTKNFDVMHQVVEGVRPDRPEALVDDELWALIEACWHADPKARPSSAHVAKALNEMAGESETASASLSGTDEGGVVPLGSLEYHTNLT
jgi:Protein tyrosine and serine/threonine kinase